MSLPTNTDVATLDYVYNGIPFCNVASNSTVDTSCLALDVTYNGMPFVGQPFGAALIQAIIVFIGA